MSRTGFPTIRLAAAQAAPVFLDREATVDKACELIREAGRMGADIVGFPEGFIPAHPVWYYHFPALSDESLAFAERLFHNAVEVPSGATDALCAAAAAADVNVVMGMCQRTPGTAGTMFNSQLYISRQGEIVGVHQKLVPTAAEKLVHAPGSGAGMRTFPMDFGAAGGLICGENSNPLAIHALLANQVRVHVSSWPNYFAPGWPPGMAQTALLTGRAIAYMSKCFVINACGTIDAADAAMLAQTPEHRAYLDDPANLGGSTIVAPTGEVLAGPAGAGDEVICAEADLGQVVRTKLVHDFAGHYQRMDVFSFAMSPSDPHLQPHQPVGREQVTKEPEVVPASEDADDGPASG